jgi:hypothetical protein
MDRWRRTRAGRHAAGPRAARAAGPTAWGEIAATAETAVAGTPGTAKAVARAVAGTPGTARAVARAVAGTPGTARAVARAVAGTPGTARAVARAVAGIPVAGTARAAATGLVTEARRLVSRAGAGPLAGRPGRRAAERGQETGMRAAGPASGARRESAGAPRGTSVTTAATADRRRAPDPASAVGRAVLPDRGAAPAVLPIGRAGQLAQVVELVAPPADRPGPAGPRVARTGLLGRPAAQTGQPQGETEAPGTGIGDRIGGTNGLGARRAEAHQPPGARLGRARSGIGSQACHPGNGRRQPDGAKADRGVPVSEQPATEAGAGTRIGRPAATGPA